jgi:DNA-directed RNA polymerase subunit RPC12/RpoP
MKAQLPISFLKPDGTWRNEEDRILCPYCGTIADCKYTICTRCKTQFSFYSSTAKVLAEEFKKMCASQ